MGIDEQFQGGLYDIEQAKTLKCSRELKYSRFLCGG